MFTIKDILFDTARLALADSRILTPKNHVPILKTATSLKDAREAVGSNNVKLHAVVRNVNEPATPHLSIDRKKTFNVSV